MACAAFVAIIAFAFLFLSTSVHTPPSFHHAASIKLKRPVVLLISADGFRFGYQHKTATPSIHRLIARGTEAETGLIPVFPTLTFPNYYSIVTGLYPAYHGIVNKYFIDPTTGAIFKKSLEPHWWLGEPLWETVVKHGLKASIYFWPGSEVKKGSWNCPPKFCPKYNGSVALQDRVDTVLGYFGLPSDEIPSFITLCFPDPDAQGHQFGPDDPRITEAVANIDMLIGKLIHGLEKKGIFEDVNIILLGDHGMVGTCDKKVIFLDDLKPWITIPPDWVQFHYPVLSIRPPAGVSPSEVITKMRKGLALGKVQNGLVDEGFKVEQNDTKKQECAGDHGYDNALLSTRSIFIGHGPRFARGRKVPSFENVEIYNVITSILTSTMDQLHLLIPYFRQAHNELCIYNIAEPC